LKTVQIEIKHNRKYNCLDVCVYWSFKESGENLCQRYGNGSLALDHPPYNRFRLIERLKYKEISGEVLSQAKIIALEEIIFLSQMNIFCNCRLSIS
jgi:hypothetical protein